LKIALIGALANDKTSPLGSWRIAADDESAVSVLEGLQKYEGNKLNYVKGADVSVGRTQFVWKLKLI
jgi:beta-glucosidase